MTNEWKIVGEVSYIKVLQNEDEFGASLKIRSTSKRNIYSLSTQILELTCLVPKKVFVESRIKKFVSVCVSGHLESWDKNGKAKPFFIVDSITEE